MKGLIFMPQPQLQHPCHLHPGRHQQGRVLSPARPARSRQVPGRARDALFLRVIGSPDPYGEHIDGMGGATSSTSKCVILSESTRRRSRRGLPLRPGLHRQADFVDWSGNCGNLSAAVGAFAIHAGLVDASRIPAQAAPAVVRIWQANIGKTIIAHVPITNGQVQETGDFELDGVTFPAAEVRARIHGPRRTMATTGGAMFPTGNLVDTLDVPGVGSFAGHA